MLEDTFLRRLSRWRTYKFENNDEIVANEDREEVEFHWTRSPTLDRQRDAQTDALLIAEGLASKSTIFANNGLDYKEELSKMAEDRKMEEEIFKANPEEEKLAQIDAGK
jgi:broad specificity polyphosphatase/5'/3'-nucleotidase SurE